MLHMMDLEALRALARNRLSDFRFKHTLGCEKEAAKLAARWSADAEKARAAALVHDITKEETLETQLKLCEKWSILIDNIQKNNPTILHALTAAAVAENELGLAPDICLAVRSHTTARPDMTLLEKILFVADYTEPNRPFAAEPWVTSLRELSYKDLDLTVLNGLAENIRELAGSRRLIHTDAINAYNFYLIKRTV